MIRETLYTSIGAAALAADFVTSPQKQQTWLKKAERRGAKLAETSQKQFDGLGKSLNGNLDTIWNRAMDLAGLGETKAPTTARKAPKARTTSRPAGRPARKATGTSRARRATISVVADAPQAQAV